MWECSSRAQVSVPVVAGGTIDDGSPEAGLELSWERRGSKFREVLSFFFFSFKDLSKY